MVASRSAEPRALDAVRATTPATNRDRDIEWTKDVRRSRQPRNHLCGSMNHGAGNVEDPSDSRQKRRRNALPALLLAIDLILLAVILTRPWERDMVGPVAQVAPSDPRLAGISAGPRIGQLAPNFALPDVEGRATELALLRGRPVLINFWATWCIYCAAEMPALQRLADDLAGDATVVGVNVGEGPEEVRSFAESVGLTFPLLLDRHTDVAMSYEVPSMPTTVLVDADGVVVRYWYGPIRPTDVRDALMEVLAPPPVGIAGTSGL